MSKSCEQIVNDFIENGYKGKDCRSVMRALICCCMPNADADKLAKNLSANKCLANIVDIPQKQLVEKYGLDEAAALLINCLPDILFLYRSRKSREAIFNVGNACEYFKEILASARVETLLACFIDNDLHVVNCEVINVGSIDSVGVRPLRIIRAAGMGRSKFAFIAHNHPISGARPSNEDIFVTNSVKQILSQIGIRLLDHIIVSGSGETYSMKRAGHIPLVDTMS